MSLFLQDWITFLSVENGRLVFSIDFARSEVILYRSFLVPQAWTLGVELSFYLIAPFVLANRRVLLTLFFLSISIRVLIFIIGLDSKEYWSNRFFPAELSLFLLGAISHQLLQPFFRKTFSKERLNYLAVISTFALTILIMFFWDIPVRPEIKTILLFLIFGALLPLTFLFQFNKGWLHKIGELSYPVYISHMLVIYFVSWFFSAWGLKNNLLVGIFSCLISVGLAILLNRYIGHPVELLRDKRRAS